MNDSEEPSKSSMPSTPPQRQHPPRSGIYSSESRLNFQGEKLDSSESFLRPTDSLSTESPVAGPNSLKNLARSVTIPVTEVNPRLFELLTGKSHTDEPLPRSNRVNLTWSGHKTEGTLHYNPESDSYYITEVEFKCGPHDLDGNHI